MRIRAEGSLDRRSALKASAAAAGVALFSAKAFGEAATATDVVDTLVFLDEYPFWHVATGGAKELAAHLRRAGASRAWAGTFDGLLHKDVAGANERLTAACGQVGDGFFVPFGAINPALPDWKEDVRRCHEVHRMGGVRLHPNDHGYALGDPRLAKLLEACARRRLIVQFVLWMDDERHAYLRLPQHPPDLAPLATAAARFPELRVIVYGNSQVVDAALAAGLLNLPNVWFGLHLPGEPSSTATVRRFAERLVLGSWAPLQEVASAEKQLRSAALSADELKDALGSRARRLLH